MLFRFNRLRLFLSPLSKGYPQLIAAMPGAFALLREPRTTTYRWFRSCRSLAICRQDQNQGYSLFSYLKSGRWTFAEQRELAAGLKAGKPIEAIAADLHRSVTSAHQKARELGFDEPPPVITAVQLNAIDEAARQRAMSEKCRELALLADPQELRDRLNAMAIEYYEQAWAVEARAGLPLTRGPSGAFPRQSGAGAP
jgi:hypothetical protein